MEILIRDEAAENLEAIFAWIAKDDLSAAASVAKAVRQRLDLLATPGMARMGRPGTDEDTLELTEAYIIVYEVHDDREEIEIMAIVHGARERKPTALSRRQPRNENAPVVIRGESRETEKTYLAAAHSGAAFNAAWAKVLVAYVSVPIC
jgi:plasmid stabilization system protein ParE